MIDQNGVPRPPKQIQFQKPKRKGGVSGPRARLRDLGHLRPVFQKGILDSYLEWALAEKDDFVVWLGPKPHVIVVRPASMLQVVSKDELFLRNSAPSAFLFNRGLLRIEGEQWQKLRQILVPSFRGGAMNQAVPIIQAACDELIKKWSSQPIVRPNRDLSFLMLQILGRAVFGFEFDRERHSGSAMHRALVTLAVSTPMAHILSPTLVKLRFGRAIRKALTTVNALAEEILQKSKNAPVIEALRKAHSEGILDEEQLMDNIRGLLIAGHETSATAISWSVAMLAQHPEQANLLAAERELSHNVKHVKDVKSLVQANRWSKETMRLYPPVPLSVSQATKDTQLGNIFLPARTRVDVSSFILHRLPWLWERPNEFRPQRFERPPIRGSYLPYLHGPHTCLGMHLAELEVPLVTAKLAAAFRFNLPQGPPKANMRLSLHPSGLVVGVEKR